MTTATIHARAERLQATVPSKTWEPHLISGAIHGVGGALLVWGTVVCVTAGGWWFLLAAFLGINSVTAIASALTSVFNFV